MVGDYVRIYKDIENYLYWVDDKGNLWELKPGDYAGKLETKEAELEIIGIFKIGD